MAATMGIQEGVILILSISLLDYGGSFLLAISLVKMVESIVSNLHAKHKRGIRYGKGV